MKYQISVEDQMRREQFALSILTKFPIRTEALSYDLTPSRSLDHGSDTVRRIIIFVLPLLYTAANVLKMDPSYWLVQIM